MTGAELRAHRRAAGMSQSALAQRAEVSREAVRYWEAKPEVDPFGWAPRRIFVALGLGNIPAYNARARPWGVSQRGTPLALWHAQAEAQLALFRDSKAKRAARLRVMCEAKTRMGTPCRRKSEPGKRRCKFHGGKSTGPRTQEGRARIAEAQRRRWLRRIPPTKLVAVLIAR